MAKVNWESLIAKVKNTDKAILTKVVSSIDGHTIYDPKQFTEAGLDEAIVNAFTKTQHSGETAKETIFDNNGNAMPSVKGVYGLDLLGFIASVFNVNSWKLGRGSRAAHLAEQLIEQFNCTK